MVNFAVIGKSVKLSEITKHIVRSLNSKPTTDLHLHAGHHGEEEHDIEADHDVPMAHTEVLDGVDEFRGALHVTWIVPYACLEAHTV